MPGHLTLDRYDFQKEMTLEDYFCIHFYSFQLKMANVKKSVQIHAH